MTGPWINGPVTDPGAIGITGGTGVPIKLGNISIPMISAPTGTMANNGAITLGTALDRTYANCFLFLPAGAVAAGVPAAAGWLYAEMSSTTVGTVFNNAYTTGDVLMPTKVAFVTTGPGAFTGDTTEQGAVFTVPVLNAGARIWAHVYQKNNNSAGTKTPRIRLNGAAGTQIAGGLGQTTNTDIVYEVDSYNVTQSAQNFLDRSSTGTGTALHSAGQGTVAMTAPTDIRLTTIKNTATDYSVIEYGSALYIQ